MPNYCENDLWIQGGPKDVAALLAFVGADRNPVEFDFNAIVPYPKRYAAMDAEYPRFPVDGSLGMAAYVSKWGTNLNGFNSGGYEWCCDNWGTKWRASNVRRRDYGDVCVTFRTAYYPPKPVIIALAKRFPFVTLRLEYFERGMQFAGGFACLSKEDFDQYDREGPWEAGAVVNEWESEYKGHRGG